MAGDSSQWYRRASDLSVGGIAMRRILVIYVESFWREIHKAAL
jgi:hypothetical protein